MYFDPGLCIVCTQTRETRKATCLCTSMIQNSGSKIGRLSHIPVEDIRNLLPDIDTEGKFFQNLGVD